MENTIFRKKSLDTISSPEQLDDYIRVTNCGVWLVLGALILLLIGALSWGVFGSFMVKKTMDDIRYEYRNGRNILTLIKNLK